jgi:hypothetical protein
MYRFFRLFWRWRLDRSDRSLERFLASLKQMRTHLHTMVEECEMAIATLDVLEQRATRLRPPVAPEPRAPQVLTADQRQAPMRH